MRGLERVYAPFNAPTLDRKMCKLLKKDKPKYEMLQSKMEEIAQDPHHYKSLGNVMAGTQRVHIGSFVLTFTILEDEKKVVFLDVDHHDKIYRN